MSGSLKVSKYARDSFIGVGDLGAFGKVPKEYRRVRDEKAKHISQNTKNIEEGRKMYDQLSPLGPILLALTAATPVYKGFLADTDVRWNQISRAVDCRTAEELGEKVCMMLQEFKLLLTSDSHWRMTDGEYQSRDTPRTAHISHRIPA